MQTLLVVLRYTQIFSAQYILMELNLQLPFSPHVYIYKIHVYYMCLSTYIHMCIYAHMCIRICVHTHVCMCMHIQNILNILYTIYTPMYIEYIHLCVYIVYIYSIMYSVCVYTILYIYYIVYMYIYAHVCIYSIHVYIVQYICVCIHTHTIIRKYLSFTFQNIKNGT